MRTCQMSFVAAIAAVAFTVGCAAPGDSSSSAITSSVRPTADAVLYINGLA